MTSANNGSRVKTQQSDGLTTGNLRRQCLSWDLSCRKEGAMLRSCEELSRQLTERGTTMGWQIGVGRAFL